MTASEQELRLRLNSETARIPWHELRRHYATGAVITVDPEQDLIEVATHIALDDTATVEAWLRQDRIRRTTTAEAERWTTADQEVWCVVVAPWVLVQAPEANA